MMNMSATPTPKYLTIGQVAEMFSVATQTINRWAKDGLIPSHKFPSGRRRFIEHEITPLLPHWPVEETLPTPEETP